MPNRHDPSGTDHFIQSTAMLAGDGGSVAPVARVEVEEEAKRRALVSVWSSREKRGQAVRVFVCMCRRATR
jgi:hypothetical protein